MYLDWTPSPVRHFDFNAENYSKEDGLELLLDGLLRDYEKIYDRDPEDITLSQRFKRIIKSAYEKTGRQVAILIDEYDKPLLDIEDYPETFEKNQRTLMSFFGNLKSMDRYIRFAFITGVARFSRVSIFSDLNNLDDISLEDAYADICGWSEEELLRYFRHGIQTLAEKRKEDFDTILKELRDYYDGYLFTNEGTRLYNPYSILKALKKMRIDPYWFDSGTPTFLARRIRRQGTFPPDINGKKCDREALQAVGLNDSNPIPLMFQTGYLTIYDYNIDTGLYELRFPNREVEKGFYQQLLKVYVPDTTDSFSPFDFTLFKTDLAEGRPGEYNRSVREAMDQMHSRDYAGRYAMDIRQVYLIGANFIENADTRGLEYEIEALN